MDCGRQAPEQLHARKLVVMHHEDELRVALPAQVYDIVLGQRLG